MAPKILWLTLLVTMLVCLGQAQYNHFYDIEGDFCKIRYVNSSYFLVINDNI